MADEFVLYTKTLGAHWNLEGHDFHTKHLFFEEHYNSIKKTIDSVAERMRKIGSYAPATLSQFLELTHLTEKSKAGNSSQDYIKMLQFIRGNISQVKETYNDLGTADFLTGLFQEHEDMAWMLRANLSKEKLVKKPAKARSSNRLLKFKFFLRLYKFIESRRSFFSLKFFLHVLFATECIQIHSSKRKNLRYDPVLSITAYRLKPDYGNDQGSNKK